MYISTFEFKQIRLLRNADLVHKTVMMMFDNGRAEENVLYMLMDSKKDSTGDAPIHMIIQSDNQPKNIPSALKLLNSRECSGIIGSIKNGDAIRFYGVFEPLKKDRTRNQNKHNIYPLKSLDGRIEWMNRKFSDAGKLIAINEVAKNDIFVQKNTGESHHSALYGYECLLQVSNADKLRELIRHGIGRSKAYGAGLCLVLEVNHV